jgi:hypothetical protein
LRFKIFNFWLNCAKNNADCDGNGDGLIHIASTIEPHGGDEVLKAWRHLYLAEMLTQVIDILPAKYPGLIPGKNVPQSKMVGAGYFMGSGNNLSARGYRIHGKWEENKNMLFIGMPQPKDTLIGGALTPEEAFMIDQKIDDGTVSLTRVYSGGITGNVRVATGIDSPIYSCIDKNNNYNLSVSERTCVLGAVLD